MHIFASSSAFCCALSALIFASKQLCDCITRVKPIDEARGAFKILPKMYDKEALQRPPAPGTCCGRIESTKGAVQTREYIYNLLAQQTSVVNPQKRLPRIRPRRTSPPPLPDAVPKAPYKTMDPPPHPHPEVNELPQKIPFKPKHWRTPFMDRGCVKEKVRLDKIAFEKLKLEKPAGRIKDACCAGVRPPIPPNQGGEPIACRELPHRTNWIERNAIRAITSKPGYRIPNADRRMIVDTRRGDKQALVSSKTHSGLEKLYVYKPTFGRVPRYLRQRAEAIAKTREAYSHYLNEKDLQRTDYILTEKERGELLSGLKTAWDKYNAKYLGLSASRSGAKQKSYGDYLEKQLASLERDIEMIESHPYIFVDADKTPGVGGSVTNDIQV
ncbi:Enkurin [Echinococcus granulosus]|nr:Enkurin [Echinococcus granulosus]